MSDQQERCCEEQEMETEALSAIFDSSFEVLSSEQPFKWSVKLLPVECDGDDPEEVDRLNHVGIKVVASLPLDYPEEGLPDLHIELVKGLAPHHEEELLQLANEEAQANMGVPSIYAICERLKDWLTENNVKGLDDVSMHAQMLRRNKEAEKKELAKQQETIYESQKQVEEFTAAELEEQAVRKRRAEGTPCTPENFEAWKAKFEQELAEKQAIEKKREEQESSKKGGKGMAKKEDKSGRLTGKQQFSGMALTNLDLEAMEAAAVEDEAEEDLEYNSEDENEDLDPNANASLDVDEELFDVDDEDLDDLDFDDDIDDDDEEQPDI